MNQTINIYSEGFWMDHDQWLSAICSTQETVLVNTTPTDCKHHRYIQVPIVMEVWHSVAFIVSRVCKSRLLFFLNSVFGSLGFSSKPYTHSCPLIFIVLKSLGDLYRRQSAPHCYGNTAPHNTTNMWIASYLRIVLEDVQSSKRMLYPTSWPRPTSISSATRAATDMAATLRGWVQATPFFTKRALTHSRHHWGIYNTRITQCNHVNQNCKKTCLTTRIR